MRRVLTLLGLMLLAAASTQAADERVFEGVVRFANGQTAPFAVVSLYRISPTSMDPVYPNHAEMVTRTNADSRGKFKLSIETTTPSSQLALRAHTNMRTQDLSYQTIEGTPTMQFSSHEIWQRSPEETAWNILTFSDPLGRQADAHPSDLNLTRSPHPPIP